jgi:hypothetical protein
MTILPLSKLLISSEDSNSGVKNATGLMRDWEALLNNDTIEALRASHDGIFCFLAFNAKFDSDILTYIESGALAAESGDEILILYCINTTIDTITFINDQDLRNLFHFESKSNVNDQIIRALFPETDSALQPGLLIFDVKANSKNAVYVPFINKYSSKTDCMRKVIEIITKVLHNKNKNALDAIGLQLLKENIDYIKNTKYSFGEHIIIIYRILSKAKSDIISIVA